MKKRILTVVLAMTSVVAFAQKKEIRKAENAVEDGNFAEAKTLLSEAEPLLSEARDKDVEKFYLNKGLAYLGTGENVSVEDLMTAAAAFKKAKELGVDEAPQGILDTRNALVNLAIQDEANQDFGAAYSKLIDAYELHKQDTMYLYFAANYAYNAKDYDQALELYQELQDLGYTGIETQYTAKSTATGEVVTFPSQSERDIYVKTGEYTEPEDVVAESKVGEIAKTVASIYIEQKDIDKALEAIAAAKAQNPNDTSILLNEAYIYFELGDMEKYQQTIKEVLKQDPNNAVLYYNLGVSTGEMGDIEGSMDYYKKAVELDPTMINAYNNMALMVIDKRQPLVEEMNSLGMSAADNKRYDELEKEILKIYEEALVHFEKVMELDPNRIETARTMMNIYGLLNQPEKAEAMKQKISELEAASAE